jgi:antitoxin CcdA
MTAYYNPNAPKKSTNLSINSDLIQQAKALMEEKLAQSIAAQKEALWLQDNKDAIEEYNERVTINGTFSDRLRRF